MSDLPDLPDLIVPSRFCGPPSSGNGGWSAGSMAPHAGADRPHDHTGPWPAITVSLLAPPPLEVAMTVTPDDDGVVAAYDGRPVLSARCVGHAVADVEPVAPEEARAAEASYAGLTSHPFPTCFSSAGTWTPDPTIAEDFHAYADPHPRASLPVTWAALDCVGGWAGDLEERLMVLARMTARLDSLPAIGEEHVLVGMGRGRDGRKTWTSSTLYDAGGRVVASAEHLWIAVDPAVFA